MNQIEINVMEKAHSISWAGAMMAIIGNWSLADWLAISGVILALMGTIATIWHKFEMVKIERDRLEREFPRDG